MSDNYAKYMKYKAKYLQLKAQKMQRGGDNSNLYTEFKDFVSTLETLIKQKNTNFIITKQPSEQYLTMEGNITKNDITYNINCTASKDGNNQNNVQITIKSQGSVNNLYKMNLSISSFGTQHINTINASIIADLLYKEMEKHKENESIVLNNDITHNALTSSNSFSFIVTKNNKPMKVSIECCNKVDNYDIKIGDQNINTHVNDVVISNLSKQVFESIDNQMPKVSRGKENESSLIRTLSNLTTKITTSASNLLSPKPNSKNPIATFTTTT